MDFFEQTRWSPYIVGVGIGILSWLSFLISQKPLACSTTYSKFSGMVEKQFFGERVVQKPYYQKIGLDVDWQWMLVVGIFFGSWMSSIFSRDFQWQWIPYIWEASFGDHPIVRLITALFGGIALGFGARWADGCTSGHGISGTLQLAVSSWISAICFFISGIITAHIIYHFSA